MYQMYKCHYHLQVSEIINSHARMLGAEASRLRTETLSDRIGERLLRRSTAEARQTTARF